MRYNRRMAHDHDTGYKLLFSHPEMVRDLLVGYVSGEWINEADFTTLEYINASAVGCNPRRVLHRNRATSAGHLRPCGLPKHSAQCPLGIAPYAGWKKYSASLARIDEINQTDPDEAVTRHDPV
jgi:hypothetical protein